MVTCKLCGATVAGVGAAIEADWWPDYYDERRGAEDGPGCARCALERLADSEYGAVLPKDPKAAGGLAGGGGLAMREALGLVRLAVDNMGEEAWLVSDPAAVRAAFDAAVAEDGPASPLDAAARACGLDGVVLRAHWGNDIPPARDDRWLERLLERTRGADRDEARALVLGWWGRPCGEGE